MKKSAFIAFLSTVLAVYALVNLLIFIRGWQALPVEGISRTVYTIVFLLVSFSYIVGRFSERITSNALTGALVKIGSFWLAAILGFGVSLIALDLIRVANYFFDLYPDFVKLNYEETKQSLFCILIMLNSLVIFMGWLNAVNPVVKRVELKIQKEGGRLSQLNIVAMSDIHLGVMIGEKRLKKYVQMANDLNPDIILLAGDVFDEDLGSVIKQNLGNVLTQLKAKYGVYAVPGNHEYIGGIDAAIKYMTDHNIKVLQDSSEFIDSSFWLVGRDDKDRMRFYGSERKQLWELMFHIDHNHPIIMLDHQPYKLDDPMRAGVDLQISGHTHNGQIWPFSLITKKLFEVSWGYKQKGDSHFYVSCGLGSWGPAVRLGNTPEVVNILVKFQ